MKRRDLWKTPAGAAAAAVLPAAAQTSAPAAAGRAAAAWTPAVFDAHQHQTLLALLDQIIPTTDTPGARAEQVDRHLDKLLAAGPASARQDFVQGIGWLDGYARRQHGRPFAGCSAAQQLGMLEALEETGLAELQPGRRFVRTAKSTIARVYYATEAGFRELNKGGRVPATFACAPPKKETA